MSPLLYQATKGQFIRSSQAQLNTLLNRLVSFWKLGELSGTRFDAHFTNDLTDNNTVTFADGVISGTKGALFARATSEFLDIASNASLQMGDIDASGSFHFKPLQIADIFYRLMSKFNASGNDREFMCDYNTTVGSEELRLLISSDGTAGNTTVLTVPGIITDAVYNHIYWEHDAASNTIGLSLNDASLVTTAHTGGINAGSSRFMLGNHDNSVGDFLDGVLGEAGLWKRKLTTDERTILSNAASTGATHPNF